MAAADGRPGGQPCALSDTEVHALASTEVGDTFQIRVGRPQPAEPKPASVLFLSDANLLFGTAVEMTRLLDRAGFLPPLWVVGIGYPVPGLFSHQQRVRDFTPDGDERFLRFIQAELKPWVGRRFDVDPDDSTFFGGSLAGLFATHVLFAAPHTFRRYAIGSPSYWWDGRAMFRQAERYVQGHDDLEADVFISLGSEETPQGMRGLMDRLPAEARAKAEEELGDEPAPDMVADARAMVELLSAAGFPGLRIGMQVLAGEHHATAGPGNLSQALRFLHDAPG